MATRFYLTARLEANTPELASELLEADYRLRLAAFILAEEAERLHVGVFVTCVERTVTRTRLLYSTNGRARLRGPGVHDVRPVRGFDAVPVGLAELPGELPEYSEVGPEVARRVNELLVYPRKFDTVVWHRVSGGMHWHVQVPYDGLSLVPDLRRPQSAEWGGVQHA